MVEKMAYLLVVWMVLTKADVLVVYLALSLVEQKVA